MRAGPRNKLVLIQRPGGSKNTVGERVTTWTTVGVAWARIRNLSGREQYYVAQREAESTHSIEMPFARAWAGIAAHWRILWGQRFTADATTDAITVVGPLSWAVNDEVRFNNYAGVLPAPLAEGITYFVKTAPGAGVYTLSATAGGLTLDLTTAGSGTNIINGRAFVLDEPPRNVDERDRDLQLTCSEGLRYE